MSHPVAAVLEFHLVGYRRTWRASVVSSFLLPLISVVGFGLGVGAYVDAGVDGVPYLDYLVPGLLASTAMQVAVGDATWPVMGQLNWTRTYYAQAASPLRVVDIFGGHLTFIVLRVISSSLVFLLIATAFGTVHSGWAVGTLPVAALLGLAVAAPTMAYAASIPSDSYLAIFFRFAVIPMSLFAGVFFPVEALPAALRWLAYASPLWHGVDLCRAATLGVPPQWSVAGHLGYLALWSAAGWGLARLAFRRRLID